MPQPSDQVDQNYAVFERVLPSLLQTNPGEFALMHDAQVVRFRSTALAAVSDGMRLFGPGNYSVQEVTSLADDLGFYSYAGGALQA